MEDQTEIIIQACTKMIFLFYYFPEFIQERRKNGSEGTSIQGEEYN